MKKIILNSLLVLVVNCVALVSGFAMPESIQTASQNLNETVGQADLKAISSQLATVLKVEANVTEKAFGEMNLKMSDVALAKMISDKASQPIETFLKPSTDWAALLTANQISDKDAEEYLDGVNAEAAFLMMDLKPAKAAKGVKLSKN